MTLQADGALAQGMVGPSDRVSIPVHLTCEALYTARLRLRCLHEGDAAFYLQLVNEPGWLRFIGDRGIRSEEAAREAIVSGAMAMQREHGFSLWAVELRDVGSPQQPNCVIGLCGLIRRDTLPDVDIGYAMLDAYAGQGYTLEAAQAVLAHARVVLHLPRLLAITSPDHVASRHILLRLGLQLEREMMWAKGDPVCLFAIDFPGAV